MTLGICCLSRSIWNQLQTLERKQSVHVPWTIGNMEWVKLNHASLGEPSLADIFSVICSWWVVGDVDTFYFISHLLVSGYWKFSNKPDQWYGSWKWVKWLIDHILLKALHYNVYISSKSISCIESKLKIFRLR